MIEYTRKARLAARAAVPVLPSVRSSVTARLLAAAVAAAGAAEPAAAPAGASSASRYQKERADCESGRTAQDRATCLKEAGAAQDESRRNRLDNAGSMPQNATDRCKTLPVKEQADCLARIGIPTAAGQRTTTSGSVGGGGILRETTTTVPGAPASGAASSPPLLSPATLPVK